jgi:hypothetical protein
MLDKVMAAMLVELLAALSAGEKAALWVDRKVV